LILILTFSSIGERERFCRWDDVDERVDESLLMIGDGGFPNSTEPTVFVDLAWAVDKFYSPSIVCTGAKVDLMEIYFNFFLV
jgi:hypothetical protein